MRILILFLMFISFRCNAQELAKYNTSFQCNTSDQITYMISTNNDESINDDTLAIELEINNNSESTIYIFDPLSYLTSPYTVKYRNGQTVQTVELGGDWLYLPGYKQSIFLASIPSMQSKKYFLTIVTCSPVSESNALLNSDLLIGKNLTPLGLVFSFGYINSNVLEVNDIPSESFEYKIFNSKVGEQIYSKMKRFYSVPLLILKSNN